MSTICNVTGFIAGGCYGCAAYSAFMGNQIIAVGLLAIGSLFAFITLLLSE